MARETIQLKIGASLLELQFNNCTLAFALATLNANLIHELRSPSFLLVAASIASKVVVIEEYL